MKNLAALTFILLFAPPLMAQIKPITAPHKAVFARPFDVYFHLPPDAQPDKTDFEDFTIINTAYDGQTGNVKLSLMPFNVGDEVNFPPLTFKSADGVFTTESFPIKIAPAKTRGGGLIDIRGPKKPFNWPLAALLFALAFLYVFGQYLRRRKKRAAAAAAPNPKTAEQAALDAVALLLAERYWQSGQHKVFYIKLVDILRDYLSLRDGRDYHKLTARELDKKFAPAPYGPQIKLFNASANLVKFAKVSPTEESRDQDIARIKEILRLSAAQRAAKEAAKAAVKAAAAPKAKEVKK